ncbi:hypothetical protein [Streptomyces canus]|uniref:hypothetical protein n=1 Tax=Streptomyces canus TaxID=58343 RepID=UPI002E34C0CC|nr:hypothetical protein [Streptomyces canus]
MIDPAVEITRSGPSPVNGLDGDALATAPPELGASYERVLAAMGDHGGLVQEVLDVLAEREHPTWLVGGAVRDLLAQGAEARVNDLDFTGTAGPGELTELTAERRLRRAGFGDYDRRVSPRLVWSISPAEFPQHRVMEYRPLVLGGFAFPAYGGGLAIDAVTRDLTVNALYYDHQRGVVADPTGQGRAHLEATPRIMAVPYQDDEPVGCACVILRCLKFWLHQPDADIGPAAAWVGTLPADLATRIPEGSWPRVLGKRAACVAPGHRGGPESELAGRLGPAAAHLLQAIQERTP